MTHAHAASKLHKPTPGRREAVRRESRGLPRRLSARSRPGDTTLQRHVSFFDDDGDRVVGVTECTRGLKALGLPVGVAEAVALAIVVPLSIQTRRSVLAMSIDVENIHRGKHDSDTGILDKRGRFNARRFEQVFGAHATADRDGDKAITATEIGRMVIANRRTLLGSAVSLAEWQLLLLLAADTEALEAGKAVPALSIERIKAFYDGTLLYKVARERVRGLRAKLAAREHARGES
ncbi:MAG TPA: caleosin family protein [Casimicrobiaceae bacterium]|nr:caleosin family protein [Casimicrobiaceae bacterium]